MRKILIMLIAMLLMLCGCKKEAQSPVSPEIEYNTEGERVVLLCGDTDFPISFTVDGRQKIEDGTYFYYELNGKFGREWKDFFYLYHREKLDLLGYEEYGAFNQQPYFATNGNWPLFLNPVHMEYSVSNQERLDASLINAGNKILEQNQMAKVPLIISDTWLCDMDQDGEEEYFFKACNYSVPIGMKGMKNSIKDELSLYCFLAYVDGEHFQMLDGSFKNVMNENADDQATSILSSYSYGEQGELITSVLKKRKEVSVLRDLRPIVSDPDGDGVFSVYVYKKAEYKSLSLMNYADGCFIPSYEIIY